MQKKKHASAEDTLSRRERQIMDILYLNDRATAREILEQFPDKIHYSTIRTLLRVLEKKGHIAHTMEGRTFFYAPTRPRSKAAESALKRLVETFYKGSLEMALTGLLGIHKGEMNSTQLKRLEQIIEKAKKEES